MDPLSNQTANHSVYPTYLTTKAINSFRDDIQRSERYKRVWDVHPRGDVHLDATVKRKQSH